MVSLSVLAPNPIRKLKSCPANDPVQAITPYPKDARLAFANKSANVFPTPKTVAPSRT